MPYRIMLFDQEVTCDTKEELVALAALTATSRGRRRKQPEKEKKAAKTVKGWAKGLASKQRDLVKALAASHPNSLSDTQIKEQLGLENNRKIAGLMGGLAKAAKRAEQKFDALIQKEATRNGTGERHYHYGIVPTAIAEVKQGLGMEK